MTLLPAVHVAQTSSEGAAQDWVNGDGGRSLTVPSTSWLTSGLRSSDSGGAHDLVESL
jgi:hypothetical protein